MKSNIAPTPNRNSSVSISADSLSGFVSDYNAVVNLLSNDDGNNHFLTLAQWQSQTGQDPHSFISTPSASFTNPAANDYHLKPGSPPIDAGRNRTRIPCRAASRATTNNPIRRDTATSTTGGLSSRQFA